ncbi:hypothetical protein KI688_001442 [Linnemannia hyalina]|uniref:Uncharacterized protein n=1 Tax=Linnemannia hyalina TaxID=64524 RepID=A0A9P8BSN2_9FUNG|nr:hypothetical protein KI688_001442 [Linnemannia hyalina]
MFDTLAPKLNGGIIPSGQPNSSDNNNLGQGSSTSDLNAQPSSNNHNQSRAGIQQTTNPTTVRSTVQPQPSQPPPARQFKAFAKGFSGLGADVLSDLSRPSDQRQGAASSAAPKTTSTTTSVYTLTERGSREHQAKYSTASFGISAGTSTGAPSTSVPVVAPAIDVDTSFGGDDFFLDADDLADLEHDLDLGQGQSRVKDKGKDKDNEDVEDISLSWSPTPPKVAKANSSTPLSPQSPLSRFSTTVHSTVYIILQTPSQRNGWDIQHHIYGVQFFTSIDSYHWDARQATFVLQSLSDRSGSTLQSHIFDVVF